MKSGISFLVIACCATLLSAQTTSSPSKPATPASGSSSPSGSSSATGGLHARGPEAVAAQDPNRVVATIAGKPVTAKEALDLLKPLPPQERKRYESNLQSLVQQIYMEDQLADQAIKLNLDQQSPWKDQLRMARANILTQAYLNKVANSATAGAAQDPKQYYDAHPEDFEQYELSGIFIGFNPPGTPSAGGAAARTEEQARQKADDVEKKLKAGGDFAALARTESDNQQSAAKGGDLGPLTLNQPGLPPDIKAAIQKLKPGEVAEPVRMPNGFFILKLTSQKKIPFEEARPGIAQRLQNDKNQAAVKQELDKYKIEVKDPDFFNASNAAAPRVPSLQRPGGTAVPATPPAGSASSKPPASR